MAQKPTIGRIVHFQTYGTPGGEHPSEPIAAIITKVYDETSADGTPVASNMVDLFAIYPNGTSHKTAVRRSGLDKPMPGCWNWPPRVEG